MREWNSRVWGVAAVSLLVVAAVVGAFLVDGNGNGSRTDAPLAALASASRAASPAPESSAGRPSTAGPGAPDEPTDAPRAWTAQDPSVEAPPAEVVAEAAPEADEATLLRVVSVVNRDGRPAVVVQKVRGPDAAAETVEEAQTSEDVVAVSVDTRVTLDAGARSANLVRADVLRAEQWALDRLQAARVWTDYSSGARTVTAVIDTGVDGGHPDLAGQFTTAGVDYVSGNGDGRVDPHGHGTHVAGVIAAVRGNTLGVAGLAPLTRIMPIRVLDASGAGWSSNIAKGIVYAADNGADVINLSLGGPTEDSATKVAVNYAMSKGVIVVAAAGNSRATGNATNYPAAYPGVLAVASTERGDTSSAFSNTGPYIDIAAPGGRILSTVPGGYGYMSGTSMATPFVAATAALVADITGGTVTTEQFERRITAAAWDLGAAGWDPEFGYGLVNPHQSLCSFSDCGATQTPAPTPSPTLTPSPSPPATSRSAAPAPAPAPAPSPTETLTPVPRATATPQPTTTAEPAPTKRRPRLKFTTGGGTVARGQRVPVRLRATYADTGEPMVGHRVLIRGWRNGTVAVRRWVTTNDTGRAVARVRVPATTRFDLRTPPTGTTRAASSTTSIRWRVR